MIFLRISSRDEKKIERIAEILLSEKLAIDLNFKPGISRIEYVNGQIQRTKVCLLTAKTRANLFRNIDGRIREEFPENLPEIYSLPIIEMDWEQAQKLIKDLGTDDD
jgi:uncharacterized protein involved in tolerance to divalent cations